MFSFYFLNDVFVVNFELILISFSFSLSLTEIVILLLHTVKYQGTTKIIIHVIIAFSDSYYFYVSIYLFRFNQIMIDPTWNWNYERQLFYIKADAYVKQSLSLSKYLILVTFLISLLCFAKITKVKEILQQVPDMQHNCRRRRCRLLAVLN